MARKRKPEERKLRTRQHIIADLSVNYVERQILLCGHSANRVQRDYGLDLLMNTHNENGEVENGYVNFQLKATDKLRFLRDNRAVSVRIEVADIRWWQDEPMPVILVIYDGQRDQAYWLYVQRYLQEKSVRIDALGQKQSRLTFHIPVKNRINRKAVEMFREFRRQIVEQIRGVKHDQ